MSFVLITGIIFTTVPAVIIFGFMMVIFVSFMRDDDDAIAITRIAVGTMIVGLLMIAFHFLSQYIV